MPYGLHPSARVRQDRDRRPTFPASLADQAGLDFAERRQLHVARPETPARGCPVSARTDHFDLVAAQLVVDGAVIVIGSHGLGPLPGGPRHPGAKAGDEGPVDIRRSDDLARLIVCDLSVRETLHQPVLIRWTNGKEVGLHRCSPTGADPPQTYRDKNETGTSPGPDICGSRGKLALRPQPYSVSCRTCRHG